MARKRSFDEAEIIRSAAKVFTRNGYEGTSIDDLVRDLGIHRGSLYRTFGSKLALFHTALGTQIDQQILPWIRSLGTSTDGVLVGAFTPGEAQPPVELGLLLIAAVERAPFDPVVAAQVDRVFAAIEDEFRPSGAGELAAALAAVILGLQVQIRAGLEPSAALRAAAALSRAVPS